MNQLVNDGQNRKCYMSSQEEFMDFLSYRVNRQWYHSRQSNNAPVPYAYLDSDACFPSLGETMGQCLQEHVVSRITAWFCSHFPHMATSFGGMLLRRAIKNRISDRISTRKCTTWLIHDNTITDEISLIVTLRGTTQYHTPQRNEEEQIRYMIPYCVR